MISLRCVPVDSCFEAIREVLSPDPQCLLSVFTLQFLYTFCLN